MSRPKAYSDGTGRGPLRITNTDQDRAEFRRMAYALPESHWLLSMRLLGAADCDTVPIHVWDELKGYYRSWLVFDTLPGVALG